MKRHSGKDRWKNNKKVSKVVKFPENSLNFNTPFSIDELSKTYRDEKGTATGTDQFSCFVKHMPVSTLELVFGLF